MTAIQVAGRGARVLAIASIAGFWVLPFSPLLAIGALVGTEKSVGWPRRVAVAGAGLCSAYTLAMGLGVARMAWSVWA